MNCESEGLRSLGGGSAAGAIISVDNLSGQKCSQLVLFYRGMNLPPLTMRDTAMIEHLQVRGCHTNCATEGLCSLDGGNAAGAITSVDKCGVHFQPVSSEN